jgi:hypothetical protein
LPLEDMYKSVPSWPPDAADRCENRKCSAWCGTGGCAGMRPQFFVWKIEGDRSSVNDWCLAILFFSYVDDVRSFN